MHMFRCPMCTQTFRFPYSLRAHMRFRCSSLSKDSDMNGKSRFSPYSDQKICTRLPLDPAIVPSPTSSISPGTQSTGTNSSGSISPCATEERHSVISQRWSSAWPTETPRYSGESDSSSNETPFSAPLNLKRNSSSLDEDSPKRHKFDQNQNVPDVNSNESDEEKVSAFRKVEKIIAPPNNDISPPSAHYSIGTTATTSLLTNSLLGSAANNRLNADKSTQHMMSSFRPMLPPEGLPASYLPGYRSTLSASENLPINLAELYSTVGLKLDLGRRNISAYDRPFGTDPLPHIREPDIRKISPPMALSSHMRNRSPPKTSIPRSQQLGDMMIRSPLQFYRSPNPMVDKLLTSATSPRSPAAAFSPLSPSSLTQNWCAKCNATFRMTSDLVYHMRSHHKSAMPGVTLKKTEEKLKCTICSETFKERHHLTRHMSSHI